MEKYLMLDRRLLSPQAMENIRMEVARPVKDAAHNPLFTQDQPWEVRIDNGYPNVLYDEEARIYRCYYTLFIEDEDSRLADLQERGRRDYIPRPEGWPTPRAGTESTGRSRPWAGCSGMEALRTISFSPTPTEPA